jgi:holo-[acyl-carrier protein] synthase
MGNEDRPLEDSPPSFAVPAVPVAIGVDLIERTRVMRSFARFGERFLRRVFTATELEQAGYQVERLVGRFAAKEACSKALGTGMITVAWREIEIIRGTGGKPVIHLHGRAAARAQMLGLTTFDVSISDTQDYAMAVVVAIHG